MQETVFEALARAAREQEPVTLGIITEAKGSSPQKQGAKAIFHHDGRITGTLGGGCLEAEVQQRALQALRADSPQQFELVLDHDFGWDDGLVCGGSVSGLILPNAQRAGPEFWTVLALRATRISWGVQQGFQIALTETGPGPEAWLYRETVKPRVGLWIAGAGHIAQAVAPLALTLDFDVTVFDDRPSLVSRQYFPESVHLRADTWERLLAAPLPAHPVMGLIVTRGHKHDGLVLKEWIRMPFAFLGMIGSVRKARIISEQFVADGLATPEQISRVACPVGVKIQSQTVQEIAVSILAQYIDRRAQLD